MLCFSMVMFMFFKIDVSLVCLWYLLMKRITVEELYKDASLMYNFYSSTFRVMLTITLCVKSFTIILFNKNL